MSLYNFYSLKKERGTNVHLYIYNIKIKDKSQVKIDKIDKMCY